MKAALFTAAGLLVWTVSWLGNGQTEEGNVTSLGLTEGEWRALLNPGTVLLALGAWYGLRGAARWLTLAGLGTALVGNVVEFGLWGDALWVDGGWAIFLLGCLVTAVGLALALLSTVWRSVARA
jgi:hypothetical protein